jgi:hypothetical protein
VNAAAGSLHFSTPVKPLDAYRWGSLVNSLSRSHAVLGNITGTSVTPKLELLLRDDFSASEYSCLEENRQVGALLPTIAAVIARPVIQVFRWPKEIPNSCAQSVYQKVPSSIESILDHTIELDVLGIFSPCWSHELDSKLIASLSASTTEIALKGDPILCLAPAGTRQ